MIKLLKRMMKITRKAAKVTRKYRKYYYIKKVKVTRRTVFIINMNRIKFFSKNKNINKSDQKITNLI